MTNLRLIANSEPKLSLPRGNLKLVTPDYVVDHIDLQVKIAVKAHQSRSSQEETETILVAHTKNKDQVLLKKRNHSLEVWVQYADPKMNPCLVSVHSQKNIISATSAVGTVIKALDLNLECDFFWGGANQVS